MRHRKVHWRNNFLNIAKISLSRQIHLNNVVNALTILQNEINSNILNRKTKEKEKKNGKIELLYSLQYSIF